MPCKGENENLPIILEASKLLMLEYFQIETGFNYTNFRTATFANIKPIPGAKVKTAGWGHNKVKPIK